MSNCNGCRAPVVWAVTPAGKSMPVDPDPTDNGNLVLTLGTPPRVRPPELTDDPDGPRWVSHFATCPQSEDFRK